MKNFISICITTIALLLLSSGTFSQTLEFGTLDSFEAYAGVGAVTNSGTASGDAGTNAGAITGTGFEAVNGYTGTTHVNSSLTYQARIDLLRVYIHLDDVFVTEPSTHAPAFGGGETISPGVYSIAGAGSVAGALTLDGGGDANAVFIMKFEGAFTVEAGSEIILTGGTRVANVFWISQGAISVATTCVIKGSLFAHPGAVTLGVGSTIEGRLLTSEGAITIAAGGVADMPVGPSTIPINCIGDCSSAPTVDVLGSLKDFAFFTSLGAVANAATSGIVGAIGTNGGAISGFLTSTHTNGDATTGFVYNSDAVTAQAVIDLDNAYAALMALPNDFSAHTPAFGSGETLTTGVYHIAGAGSLAGSLTLDGEGDPNAIFVFKFAGAFSVAAQSRVILVNGARRCNIFWISGAGVATGAMDLGTFTYMKGTLIAHGGACSAGANSSVEGRMLSTGGAIGFSTGVVYNDELCFSPPESSVIDAVEDNTAPVNGTIGGTTTSLTSNDILNGNPVVIGTAPGNVILTGLTVPPGFTLNPDGTVTIPPNTPAGDYSLTYQICEVSDPTNCDSVTATIVVSAPGIDAVEDTTDPVNGTTGGTTTSLTTNDILNGDPVVIGTDPGNVILTGLTVPPGFTLNPDGTVTIPPNTPAGDYPLTYQICEVSNPTNCDSVTSTIVVSTPGVALVKSSVISGTGNGLLGEVITYTFEITNTGSNTLTNVVVTDPMVGLTITGSPIATLVSGASSSVITGTYTITQDDVDAGGVTNSALATAQDPNGIAITDTSGTANDNDTPTVTTSGQTSTITLMKTAIVSGTGMLGDVITYIFTLENTGNTTLTNIVVTDPMITNPIIGSPIASLAPGGTTIAMATYTITQSDIDAGGVTNSATATAQDPSGIDVTDTSGTQNDNDTPTDTPTAPPVVVLADFTPTIDIDALNFSPGEPARDFVINISPVEAAPSDGQVVVKMAKGNAFTISYGVATSTSNVGGGVSVNNNDWDITENPLFITMTLKAGVVIGANTFSAIGFAIERNVGVPSQTAQPITATIVDGSGSDSQNYNNTYNTVVTAQ
jgi:hypothetical protein